MSKSLLIIDTPQSCHDCHFCHPDMYWGTRCHADRYNTINTTNDKNHTKPDWCPLTPLPEYKDLTQYHFTGKGNTQGMTNLLLYSHDQGYNDCLYDIQKGEINK